jgi:hypothetical protein
MCTRKEIKRLGCSYEIVRVFNLCDEKMKNRILYWVAVTDFCDRRRAPFVLDYLLWIGGGNARAVYKRRTLLTHVLNAMKNEWRFWHFLPVAHVLLTRGADPNTRDAEGNTLLHYVAKYDFLVSLVVELLARGADPNAQNKNGETSLHVAVRYRSTKTIKILLEHGANPRIRDKDGRTPLDYADMNIIKLFAVAV